MKNLSQSATSHTVKNTLTASSFSVQCAPDKCPLLRQVLEKKEKEIALLIEENRQLAEKLEQLTGTKNLYSHMLFGRSSKVPLKHLSEKAQGIVIADRFSAYGKLAKMVPGLTVAICWAHFRRDFINAGKSFAQLKPWVFFWKKQIAEVYHLNHRRLDAVGDKQRFAEAQRELEQAIEKMEADIAAELKNPTLHWEQRRVLVCAQKHWKGLTVFVRHHQVPMDNNKAERALRRIALGRKNYYGTYAEWSGQFAAICLSVLQTAVLHGLNPVAYLRYYMDACAKAGGVPDQLERFHPWNIPDDVREEYSMQRKDGKS